VNIDEGNYNDNDEKEVDDDIDDNDGGNEGD
jgi:hypothetical protein